TRRSILPRSRPRSIGWRTRTLHRSLTGPIGMPSRSPGTPCCRSTPPCCATGMQGPRLMPDTMPWILGIGSSHNGAACLLHGPEIVVAIQEERLLRYKRAEHPGAFPSLAIAYCLAQAGITASQLDAVVLCSTDSTKARQDDLYLNAQLRVAHHRVRVFTIPHHYGHAVAVYALSGMASAGVLVIDGTGSPWDEMLDSERAVIVPGQVEAWHVEGRRTPREIISLYAAAE